MNHTDIENRIKFMIIGHYFSNIFAFCLFQTAYVKGKYLKILITRENVFLSNGESFGKFTIRITHYVQIYQIHNFYTVRNSSGIVAIWLWVENL